jgi:hypothetical protein
VTVEMLVIGTIAAPIAWTPGVIILIPGLIALSFYAQSFAETAV